MTQTRTYRVKDVARITGVSVRTLHYYDEIGLLAPADRTSAGYRLYDDDSLLRLQQILIGRALGLSLDEIRRSLDDPDFDHRAALVSQRQALVARAEETAGMIRAVDKALAILDEDRKDSEMTMEQIFEGFDPKAYEAEAKARWGDTDAHKTVSRRTKDYTEEDWKTRSRPNRQQSMRRSRRSCRRAAMPTAPLQWNWRSAIGSRSTDGSILAVTMPMPVWLTSMRPMAGSPRRSTSMETV